MIYTGQKRKSFLHCCPEANVHAHERYFNGIFPLKNQHDYMTTTTDLNKKKKNLNLTLTKANAYESAY